MGNLDRRLQRLEGLRQCRTCGWPPAPGEEVDLEVLWDDGWVETDDGELASAPPESDDVEPEFCPLCGDPNVIIVTWGDIDELEEEAGADGKHPRA